jgi:hypothetical protein
MDELETRDFLYRYVSLPGPHSLRVMYLNPGADGDPERGILESVDLREMRRGSFVTF